MLLRKIKQDIGEEEGAILATVVWEGLFREKIFEQRLEGGKGEFLWISGPEPPV